MTGYFTVEEKPELERWAQSRTLPAGDVFRARLILALAEGKSYREIESSRFGDERNDASAGPCEHATARHDDGGRFAQTRHHCKWRERIPQPGISGYDVVRNSLQLDIMFTK
jgi:hypothetical protein